MKYKFGLIAKDIHNSVTPKVYGEFCSSLGIDEEFRIFNVESDQLEATISELRAHYNGFNVTMPYKVKMLDYVDVIDESALRCGSTNTVCVDKNHQLTAYNTDGWGLIRALKIEGYSVKDKKIVLVGAGGVALSIAYNLLVNEVSSVDVLNKFPDETEKLCNRFGEKFHPHALDDKELSNTCVNADYFINASVLGQVGYDDYQNTEFLDKLKKDAVVYDVNYSNPDAVLVSAAKVKGIKAFVGRSMTTCQGIRAIEIWTGKSPDEETVKKIIKELSEREN